MNKLEKIRNTPSEVVEAEEREALEAQTEAEEKEKKHFSFFTFWKKMNTVDENSEETIYVDEDGVEEKPSALFRFLNKKTTVLAACILVIGVAGFLNVRYSNPAENIPKDALTDKSGEASLETDEIAADESVAVETLEDYFALAVINRERVRDEAIEMLKDVAGSDATDVSAKNEAYVEMTRMANEIANEANIESLVKAKGFSECVAVISNDTANVIVESDGLTINEVAQIKEIVYLECGVLPDNIKIIEKTAV